MGGVAHETLIGHAERPTLLILFAAMMGLPAFLPTLGRDEHEAQKRLEQKQTEQREAK